MTCDCVGATAGVTLLCPKTQFLFYLFRGVAQLVARLLWEQDAAGSSPVTPTKKTGRPSRTPCLFVRSTCEPGDAVAAGSHVASKASQARLDSLRADILGFAQNPVTHGIKKGIPSLVSPRRMLHSYHNKGAPRGRPVFLSGVHANPATQSLQVRTSRVKQVKLA